MPDRLEYNTRIRYTADGHLSQRPGTSPNQGSPRESKLPRKRHGLGFFNTRLEGLTSILSAEGIRPLESDHMLGEDSWTEKELVCTVSASGCVPLTKAFACNTLTPILSVDQVHGGKGILFLFATRASLVHKPCKACRE